MNTKVYLFLFVIGITSWKSQTETGKKFMDFKKERGQFGLLFSVYVMFLKTEKSPRGVPPDLAISFYRQLPN